MSTVSCTTPAQRSELSGNFCYRRLGRDFNFYFSKDGRVSKFDLTEQTLERLSALKSNADDATIAKEVKTHLSNRSNLVIAKAAQIARERGTTGLLQELTAAFQKL